MNRKFLVILVSAVLFFAFQSSHAAGTNDASIELKDLASKVQTKLDAGKRAEADFSDELKQFDALLIEHKGEKTEEVAQILYVKTSLYLEVFGNLDKSVELLRQIKTDFPDSVSAKRADSVLAGLARQIETTKIQASLMIGTKFPDFDEKDVEGKPLSIASYKGKVVLVDFWATWCPPCIRELPNTLKVYEKYHDQGFEIIGVSLDDDRPGLQRFIKENKIAWPQFFDGLGRDNKLAVKYGVDAPPTFYLLDRVGTIISLDRYPDALGNLRGEALEAAVAKAVAKR